MKHKNQTEAPKKRGNRIKPVVGSSSATSIGPKKGKMPNPRK